METVTLELIRGDYKAFNLTFTQSGTPLDLTNFKLFFTVKDSTDDADSSAKIAKVVTAHSDPTAGKTTLVIDAADIDDLDGSYVYDFQLVNASGAPTTVLIGMLNVIADVTRRTTT